MRRNITREEIATFADQAAKLYDQGRGMKQIFAVCRILDENGITKDHPDRKEYLSRIGKILSGRGVRKKTVLKKRREIKAVQKEFQGSFKFTA